MRDRVVKIKREIEGMDRFVEEEMKKKQQHQLKTLGMIG